MLKEYCYECDKHVTITIKEEIIYTEIKGLKFSYDGKIAYCNECGNEVYIASISDENIEKANREYRNISGIIQTDEISELLAKYDIGQKPLAKLLNWGEVTISRYLQGLTPTKEYSNRLKELFNPFVMRELLNTNKNVLTNIAYKKINEKIKGYIDITSRDNSPLRIANYFLQKMDPEAGESITPLKLQKLVFYSQAWLLATFNKTFFNEDFQAWQHGPVLPDMYIHFKNLGYNSNDSLPKSSSLSNRNFDEQETSILEMVWLVYGKYDGKYLEKLTHSETPWQLAWKEREHEERGTPIITKESMKEYYENFKNSISPFSIEGLNKFYCFIY